MLALLGAGSALFVSMRIRGRHAGYVGLAFGLPRGEFDVNLQLLLKLIGTSLATGLERLAWTCASPARGAACAGRRLAPTTALWDFDFARQRAYFSPRWKAMLGYEPTWPRPDVDWRALVHPDDLSRVQIGDPQARGRQDADFREHAPHASPQRRMALGDQPRQGAHRQARPAAAAGRRGARHHRTQALRGGAVPREGERADHAAVHRRRRHHHRRGVDHRLHQPGGREADRLAPGGRDGPAGRRVVSAPSTRRPASRWRIR